jgi:uncharacterized protein (TIGR02118 family)
MAAHLLVLYPQPLDAASFDRAYRTEHLPYADPRLADATGVATRKVVGPGTAPAYHLLSDISFPTIEALQACAASRGGQEALAHAGAISSGGAPTVLVVLDEA